MESQPQNPEFKNNPEIFTNVINYHSIAHAILFNGPISYVVAHLC